MAPVRAKAIEVEMGRWIAHAGTGRKTSDAFVVVRPHRVVVGGPRVGVRDVRRRHLRARPARPTRRGPARQTSVSRFERRMQSAATTDSAARPTLEP